MAWRISFFGDEIEEIAEFDPLTGKAGAKLDYMRVYANSHYVTPGPTMKQAMEAIKAELAERLAELVARRQAAGGAAAGAAHQFRPRNDRRDRQLRGDRELFALPHRTPARRAAADAVRISARQRAAVRRRKPPDHAAARRDGARRPQAQADAGRIWLPPAELHRQPAAALQRVGCDAPADGFVSATPGPWELEQTGGVFTEQVIRPTGLIDPPVEIRPVEDQVQDMHQRGR
jgi:excinuclease ABC subunit B